MPANYVLPDIRLFLYKKQNIVIPISLIPNCALDYVKVGSEFLKDAKHKEKLGKY